MLANRTLRMLSAGALIALAGPALADPPYWAPAHGFRHKHDRPVVIERHHAPVVVHRVYVERRVFVEPAPVVVHRVPVVYTPPVYAAPAPVYDAQPVYAGA